MGFRHTTARGYVRDAAEHTRNSLDRLKELQGMDDERLRIEAIMIMERGIVVSGAVLEEVSIHSTTWKHRMKFTALQAGVPAGSGVGVVGILKMLGFI